MPPRYPSYQRTAEIGTGTIVTPPSVDFASSKEAIQTSNVISAAADKAINFALKKMETTALAEGKAAGASDPMGMLAKYKGQVPTSVYDKAAYDAAIGLASVQVEADARDQMSEAWLDAQKNKTEPGVLDQILIDIKNGYSSALNDMDPMAAAKLNARLSAVSRSYYLDYSGDHLKEQRRELAAKGENYNLSLQQEITAFAKGSPKDFLKTLAVKLNDAREQLKNFQVAPGTIETNLDDLKSLAIRTKLEADFAAAVTEGKGSEFLKFFKVDYELDSGLAGELKVIEYNQIWKNWRSELDKLRTEVKRKNEEIKKEEGFDSEVIKIDGLKDAEKYGAKNDWLEFDKILVDAKHDLEVNQVSGPVIARWMALAKEKFHIARVRKAFFEATDKTAFVNKLLADNGKTGLAKGLSDNVLASKASEFRAAISQRIKEINESTRGNLPELNRIFDKANQKIHSLAGKAGNTDKDKNTFITNLRKDAHKLAPRETGYIEKLILNLESEYHVERLASQFRKIKKPTTKGQLDALVKFGNAFEEDQGKAPAERVMTRGLKTADLNSLRSHFASKHSRTETKLRAEYNKIKQHARAKKTALKNEMVSVRKTLSTFKNISLSELKEEVEKTADPELELLYRGLVRDSDWFNLFKGQSPTVIDAQIIQANEDMRGPKSEKGKAISESERVTLDFMQSVLTNVEKSIKNTADHFNFVHPETPLKKLNFMNITTLQERVAKIEGFAPQVGLIPNAESEEFYLTEGEAQNLINHWEGFTDSERGFLLTSLADGFGEKLPQVFKQINKSNSELAHIAAIYSTNDNQDLLKFYTLGEDALGEKQKYKETEIGVTNENLNYFKQIVTTTYKNSPKTESAIRSVASSVYEGMLRKDPNADQTKRQNLWKQAVHLSTGGMGDINSDNQEEISGGLIEHNGKIVNIPTNLSHKDFKDFFEALSEGRSTIAQQIGERNIPTRHLQKPKSGAFSQKKQSTIKDRPGTEAGIIQVFADIGSEVPLNKIGGKDVPITSRQIRGLQLENINSIEVLVLDKHGRNFYDSKGSVFRLDLTKIAYQWHF